MEPGLLHANVTPLCCGGASSGDLLINSEFQTCLDYLGKALCCHTFLYYGKLSNYSLASLNILYIVRIDHFSYKYNCK